MSDLLSGKVALVTGGASGIARATVAGLLKVGAQKTLESGATRCNHENGLSFPPNVLQQSGRPYKALP